MKKSVKISLIVALCMIVGGVGILAMAVDTAHGDTAAFFGDASAQSTFTIREPFENISVDVRESDIVFAYSEDGTVRVECAESEAVHHTATVENGTLVIRLQDGRRWYSRIGLQFCEWKVTVYLPAQQYESLCVKTVSGDISVSRELSFVRADVHSTSGDVWYFAKTSLALAVNTTGGDVTTEQQFTDSIRVNTTTSDVSLSEIEGDAVTANSASGEVKLSQVCVQQIDVMTISGDIALDRCDAEALKLFAVSGDIQGTLLSDKVYTAETTSGTVHVPPSQSGGECNVKTVSGDIRFNLP